MTPAPKKTAPRKAPARAARDDAEEIEADRLAGFPHPRDVAEVHGHEAAELTLRAAFDGGRMHHGWLLTGAEGIGKATLAYAFARYVLSRPDERAAAPPGRLAVGTQTSTARQISAQSNPGLLVIRRTADAKTKRVSSVIRVDKVRRLKSFLQMTAADGGWRVVIVDPADDLNPSSANALPKIAGGAADAHPVSAGDRSTRQPVADDPVTLPPAGPGALAAACAASSDRPGAEPCQRAARAAGGHRRAPPADGLVAGQRAADARFVPGRRAGPV